MKSQSPPLGTSSQAARSEKPTHEEIAALAYQLHVGGGGQSGASVEDWLFAEYLLTQSRVVTRPSPARTVSRSTRQDPLALPLAPSASAPATGVRRPMTYALQPAGYQQPAPARAGFEMAALESHRSDRWGGINE